MALLKITCSQCSHNFFRIQVSCNREGVDMTCPECEGKEGNIHVVRTKTGETPFASCTHIPDKDKKSKEPSEPQTDSSSND